MCMVTIWAHLYLGNIVNVFHLILFHLGPWWYLHYQLQFKPFQHMQIKATVGSQFLIWTDFWFFKARTCAMIT